MKQSYFGFQSEFRTIKQGRNWTVLYTVFQQLWLKITTNQKYVDAFLYIQLINSNHIQTLMQMSVAFKKLSIINNFLKGFQKDVMKWLIFFKTVKEYFQVKKSKIKKNIQYSISFLNYSSRIDHRMP